MESPRLSGWWMAVSAVAVTAILLLDADPLIWQVVLGGVTAVLLRTLVVRSRVSMAQVTVVMVIATGLEFLGSIVWGLYTYRHAAIPFYVPFGHGIFYLLAVVGTVLTLFSVYALGGAWLGGDLSGLTMWLIALAFFAFSPSRLLLAVCCVLTIQLEWAGTAIGNWRWAEVVPGLGLSSANPPSGVGVCYCLLDMLTVAVVTSAWFRRLETVEVDPQPLRRAA